jgi:hypothetical protein
MRARRAARALSITLLMQIETQIDAVHTRRDGDVMAITQQNQ